jgi:hypothetical protein
MRSKGIEAVFFLATLININKINIHI